jgi:hypothetical protein
MKTQKDAVYSVINEVLNAKKLSIEPNGVKAALGKAGLQEVSEIVAELIIQGEVEFNGSNKYPTRDDKVKYVKGMVNNWILKDERLNGGHKYEVKRQRGTRANSNDEVINELLKLRELKLDDDEAVAMIDEAIANRHDDMRQNKIKSIDVNKLPEHLRQLAS